MNLVEAVDAVAGARGPLATLQALSDALAALAPLGPGLAEESAAPAGAAVQAAVPAAEDGTVPLPPAAETQAAQGRLTLGQLATEQAALRAAPEQAGGQVAREALPSTPLADGAGSAPRLADAAVLPVLLTPLQAPAAPPLRPQDVETPARRARDRDRESSSHDAWPEHEAPADAESRPDPDADTDADPEPATADPEAARVRALLEQGGQHEALAELARGRRVLLVLPQAGAERGVVDAAAWLAGATRAQRFAARWWPGSAGAGDGGWGHWRVFRDGDPLLGRGLASRSGGSACRVRLGAGALRLADAASARLDIADRIRFAQVLGGQWSVLVVAAPLGVAP